MSDDYRECAPRDRSLININVAQEVRFWTRELGVDETTLRSAVKAAGSSSDAVRRYLKEGKAG